MGTSRHCCIRRHTGLRQSQKLEFTCDWLLTIIEVSCTSRLTRNGPRTRVMMPWVRIEAEAARIG